MDGREPLAALTAPATAEELTRHRRAQRRGRALFGVMLLGFAGFALVMFLVALGDTIALDRSVTLAVQRVTTPATYALFYAVSWPGFAPQRELIELAILGVLLWRRLWLESGFTLLALVLGLSSAPLKQVLDRARPVAGGGIQVYGHVGGPSFPSGHVLAYTLLCGFLAYLVYTLLPDRPLLRRSLLVALLALIVLVGPSRIFLGQHWFTDVLASYFLGSALLLALLAAYRAVKARQVGTAEAQ